MKTGQDALESGLYASNCCNYPVIFDQGVLLWRCPACKRLCEWEPAEDEFSPSELDKLEHAIAEPSVE
jgi:hypothetical protein